MRVLIVEDDFVSRRLLQKIISPFGDCDIAVDGKEALDAFQLAWQDGKPYDLICLDIMLPEMDGQNVLKKIRQIEKDKGIGGLDGVKIIMTTTLNDTKNVLTAFNAQCEAYLVKPILKQTIIEQLKKLHLI